MEYASRPVLSLLARMALIAIVIGTSVTVSATERVTASLVAAGAIGWAFVPILQLLTGLLLLRGFASDRVRLLNRYFATGWAWSLWILAAHAAYLTLPAARHFAWWITLTAVLPILGTLWLLLRFCRRDLGLDLWRSLWRVGGHQTATYTIAFAYVFVAVALWPRILGLFE
jgi:hypothetical protein